MEIISERQTGDTKKPSLSIKLLCGNRTRALEFFMSDNLGPIFILYNVCSLYLSWDKKNTATINKH
jgi:hypothetical protein